MQKDVAAVIRKYTEEPYETAQQLMEAITPPKMYLCKTS